MTPPRDPARRRPGQLLYKGEHGTRVIWRADKAAWRVRYHDPAVGRRVERLEPDERRALRLAEQAERYLAAGYRARGTLADLATSYLAYLEDAGRAVRYVEKVEGMLRLHVLPHIGDVAVVRWDEMDCERVLAQAGRRSPQMRQHAGQVLRGLVSHAHRTRMLTRSEDPMLGVRYSAKSATHGVSAQYVDPSTVPSGEEVDALASAFDASAWPAWGVAVRVVSQSGPRWGELIGLHPADIDLRDRTVAVNRAVGKSNGKRFYEKLPKGDKVRRTIFYESLTDPLGRLVRDVARLRGPSGLLFVGPGGGFVERSAFRRGRFIPMACQAGWAFAKHEPPPYDWISLRHFAATTWLFELRMDLVDVAVFMGHTDPAFTLRTYVDHRRDVFARARRLTDGR